MTTMTMTQGKNWKTTMNSQESMRKSKIKITLLFARLQQLKLRLSNAHQRKALSSWILRQRFLLKLAWCRLMPWWKKQYANSAWEYLISKKVSAICAMIQELLWLLVCQSHQLQLNQQLVGQLITHLNKLSKLLIYVFYSLLTGNISLANCVSKSGILQNILTCNQH